MTEDKNKYILSINGMSKSFGRNKVLKHISMNVKPGTIMGLMGENGAGKSTMMKCLFGTYQKDEGTIVLDGKEVNFSGPKDALENGVAMVHQELNQCLERSVVDNMFLGRYPKNSFGVVDEGRMKKETSDLFRKLGITVDLTQPMKKMSVSQRQMCEIAKAISYHSKVIVLDEPMSRFGRNYLQVGFYTEMMFPKKNVRFIAVNNGVDSANPADNDFTPFLNIMNEWYAKDTSKKIKAVFKAKMRDGKRVSGAVPYGYYRKPEDKQTLYVDEASASVVRRIFQLACDGMGATAIADTLSEDKILIPSAYARQNHPEDCQCTNYHDPYTWNATTVGYILNRREYLGHTVLGKTTRDNFKTKRKRIANEDELLVFYNTHEAIIDQETYDKAQRMRKRVSPRRNSEKPAHRLSGLLYCADCGSRLAYINSKPKDGKIYDSNQAFRCSRYHNKYHSCTGHYIKASTIEMLIYQATKRVS